MSPALKSPIEKGLVKHHFISYLIMLQCLRRCLYLDTSPNRVQDDFEFKGS